MIGSDERNLRADFESARISPGAFNHREHVRLTWTYLKEFDLGEAAHRITRGLQAFARNAGQPQKYHATVTWAFLVLVQERMAALPEEHPWSRFEQESPDLLNEGRALLLRYYRRSTLDSDRARRTFVLPDRAFNLS